MTDKNKHAQAMARASWRKAGMTSARLKARQENGKKGGRPKKRFVGHSESGDKA